MELYNLSHHSICRRGCTKLLDLHPHPMMTFMGKHHMSNQLCLINPPCPHLSKESNMCQVVFHAAILITPSKRLWILQLIFEESRSRSTHASSVMLCLAHNKCIMVTWACCTTKEYGTIKVGHHPQQMLVCAVNHHLCWDKSVWVVSSHQVEVNEI